MVGIMQGFKIMISDFSEASVQILLFSAAAAAKDGAGAFTDGLVVIGSVSVFCDMHGKTPFFLIKMCGKYFFMRLMARFVLYIFSMERQW